ncbi:MAG TPA: JAB domain-containing protein [Longilinea sp.]|nr:JAB domain-containing protein [Longilinea sp.]
MKRKFHVRFGERGEEIPIEKSMNGVLAPTLRDPTPSPEDVALTRSILQAGKLMDIELLDHLVIGQGRFVSMKEKGLGFGL